jgi:hypothetical protein
VALIENSAGKSIRKAACAAKFNHLQLILILTCQINTVEIGRVYIPCACLYFYANYKRCALGVGVNCLSAINYAFPFITARFDSAHVIRRWSTSAAGCLGVTSTES